MQRFGSGNTRTHEVGKLILLKKYLFWLGTKKPSTWYSIKKILIRILTTWNKNSSQRKIMGFYSHFLLSTRLKERLLKGWKDPKGMIFWEGLWISLKIHVNYTPMPIRYIFYCRVICGIESRVKEYRNMGFLCKKGIW